MLLGESKLGTLAIDRWNPCYDTDVAPRGHALLRKWN